MIAISDYKKTAPNGWGAKRGPEAAHRVCVFWVEAFPNSKCLELLEIGKQSRWENEESTRSAVFRGLTQIITER
jgi:hypothetical protein